MELAKVQKLLGSHSAANYRAALLALLPDGRLWDKERDNQKGELYRLCSIWASEYALLEQTLYSLHSETGPISALDLKPWFEATGTSALDHSELTQRIRALIALIGGQASTAQSFTNIAAQLGYKATLAHRGGKKGRKEDRASWQLSLWRTNVACQQCQDSGTQKPQAGLSCSGCRNRRRKSGALWHLSLRPKALAEHQCHPQNHRRQSQTQTNQERMRNHRGAAARSLAHRDALHLTKTTKKMSHSNRAQGSKSAAYPKIGEQAKNQIVTSRARKLSRPASAWKATTKCFKSLGKSSIATKR